MNQCRFNVSDNIAYKLFQYNYILYTILIRYQFWVHKTLNSIYDFAISILYTFKQYWFNIVDMVWQNLIYQINYCMFTRLVAAHIGRYSMIHISIGAYLSTSGTDMAWYSDTDMVYSVKENHRFRYMSPEYGIAQVHIGQISPDKVWYCLVPANIGHIWLNIMA